MSGKDDDLVRQAQAGDRQAFKKLVEKYQSRAIALAFDILKSHSLAEDVVQESFVKAYLGLKQFEGKSSFYSWLYRIVYNMAIDFKRKDVRRGGEKAEYDELKTDYEDELAVSAKRFKDPEQSYYGKELVDKINVAMNQLSPDHRQAICLREVDGMSYDEIADVLGISKGTVMSRIFYARKKLQELLKELESDYVGQNDLSLKSVDNAGSKGSMFVNSLGK